MRIFTTCDEHDYCNKIIEDDVVTHSFAPKGYTLDVGKNLRRMDTSHSSFNWLEVGVAVGLSTVIEIILKLVT